MTERQQRWGGHSAFLEKKGRISNFVVDMAYYV